MPHIQEKSLIIWMKKDYFLVNKEDLNGFIYYKTRGEDVMVRQVAPSRKVRKIFHMASNR